MLSPETHILSQNYDFLVLLLGIYTLRYFAGDVLMGDFVLCDGASLP